MTVGSEQRVEWTPEDRAAGLLLHPTSLPGRFAVGDLGPGAYEAVDWMAAAGFRVWQVLPLGPPAFAAAPYTCLSSFAANPLLISPEALVEDGLLEEGDLALAPGPVPGRCDFEVAGPWKEALLRRACHRPPLRGDPPRGAAGVPHLVPTSHPPSSR